MATPTPMPAFAPLDRLLVPVLVGSAEAVTITVVLDEAVGVETEMVDEPVAVARPKVA